MDVYNDMERAWKRIEAHHQIVQNEKIPCRIFASFSLPLNGELDPKHDITSERRMDAGSNMPNRCISAKEVTNMRRQLHGTTFECVRGDIAQQPDMDAVVNAANAQLRIGGGVAGAIHRAAGPGLEEECRPLAPISPGDAVITGAHNLPNRYVIHCLGPVYGVDEPAESLLASCYRNTLQLAEDHQIQSIAFPAISTGAFGYPMEPAAQIAFTTLFEEIPHSSSVEHIRFVLFADHDYRIHVQVLEELYDSN